MTRPLLMTFLFALLVFTGISLWINRGAPPAPVVTETATGTGVKSDFTLTDQNGAARTSQDFKGKLMLVFFGFTHCPDICPTTLGLLTDVQNRLGEDAAKVAPILISVDPARDTPERLKEYLANFHPSITGLTGSQEQVDAALKNYKAYAGAPTTMDGQAAHTGHEGHGENYLVPHSGLIYLMGRNGEYLAHFSQEDSADTLYDALRKQL